MLSLQLVAKLKVKRSSNCVQFCSCFSDTFIKNVLNVQTRLVFQLSVTGYGYKADPFYITLLRIYRSK